jgi:hypothetical protein
VIIAELPTTDWLEALIEFEKNCHGRRAAKVNIGYGIPSDGSFAKPPKIREKTTIVNTGWITAQATPIAACLYLTKISLRAKNQNNSRYCQSSLRSIDIKPFLGLIILILSELNYSPP